MKLTKLSLAAILAAGALSSVSAAPLEEAIKDIDVSGFGRYRFETKRTNNKETEVKDNQSWHRFTLDVNFKATLDDNFFSVIGVRYDAQDKTGSHKDEGSGLTNTAKTGDQTPSGFWVRQYYVGYTGIQDTTVLFGRQPAGTFFTDDIVATGLKVANTSIPGVTLAGVFYTNFEGDDGDLGNIAFDPANPYDDAEIQQKNLWGVAAIGSFDWFGFQAWYAGLNRVAHLFALEGSANYAINDDLGVRGKAQFAATKLTKAFRDNYELGLPALKGESAVKSSTFVGVDLGVDAYGLSADAGFATYGKKGKISVHTLEDQGGLISAGEDLLNYAKFSGKHTVFFAKALYTFDAYSAGLDFVYDKEKNGEDIADLSIYDKVKSTEFVARLGYKYNSKLNFKAWYSWINQKTTKANGNTEKSSKDHFRFEARYNF